MAEEITSAEGTTETTTQPELSPIEQRAMEMGWRPKDEWKGEEHDWISADAFVARKPLFEKIESQNRVLKTTRQEMNQLRETLDQFKQHHAKVRETEYQRALADLRKEKAEALREGEAERVVQLDEQIDLVKDQIAEAKADTISRATVAASPPPELTQWIEENPWYTQDAEMKTFADIAGNAYIKNHGITDPVEVLKHVNKQVKRAFPDKFTNPNRERPSAVEGTGNRRGSKASTSKVDDSELSDQEREVMNNFVKSGLMTKEEYIAEWRSVNGK